MLVWMLDGDLRVIFGMGQESIVLALTWLIARLLTLLERLDTTSRSFLELMDHV